MAARLQYLLQDIALPVGNFFIGRGADCQLALDDPLVSRRHALIRVEEDGAFLEDLGSRNGAFLNGVRVTQIEALEDGDLIRIGSQDLCFYDTDETASGATAGKKETTQPRLSTPVPPSSPVAEEENDATFVATSPFASGGGRLVNGLAIIGGVADKALALGRAAEAERILQRSLAEILERTERGDVSTNGAASAPTPPSGGAASGPRAPDAGPPDAEVRERAAAYAVRLAAATGKGAWVDYVFRLYGAVPALIPARIVDELYAGVRKVKSTDKAVLRAYTARLREIGSAFGPAERFVQQRIEGFERWAP